jgi:GPH family glycoside/pentoside/hexuronide:cation symporter
LAGVWRYARRDIEPVTVPFVRSVLTTFRNRQFVAYLPTFILFNMAISMMTAALPYWIEAVLFKGFAEEIAKVEAGAPLHLRLPGFSLGVGKGTVAAILTGGAIAVVLLGLPAVYALGGRKGKAWVYRAAMLAGALYLPWVAFMGFVPKVSDFTEGIVFAGLIGVPMAAVFTFPNAIQADIIDYDAVLTGHRREAVYYATQATLEKIASAMFPLILALLLTLGSSPDNPLGIRLVGPASGLACFLGLIAFRAYRLPDQVTEESIRAAGLPVTAPRPGGDRLAM